jgi:hypothetical protein
MTTDPAPASPGRNERVEEECVDPAIPRHVHETDEFASVLSGHNPPKAVPPN